MQAHGLRQPYCTNLATETEILDSYTSPPPSSSLRLPVFESTVRSKSSQTEPIQRQGRKRRLKHGGGGGREEEGSGEPEEPEIYTSVARNVRYSPQATQIPQESSGNRLGFENGPIKNRKLRAVFF